MSPPRAIDARYEDPVDLIWLATARRLGLEVVRASDAYASWDGQGTLTLAKDAEFDPDDCLAQMILHELCHALVEGPEGRARMDWGLENVDDRDAVREHAADRLQAALAGRHGLRRILAVTTDWRAYYDALPEDPLADGDDPAIPLARAAFAEATEGPWARALEAALEATARIARAAAAFASEDSLWSRTE
ncbi:MAG: hypothetical protein H6744_08495 [Deltaproteobacteria bacterium]|nr:hypothetical protein [Deltaproteobacteria bacterium]MCB9786716.1 hypothetical protein [Deltaproteobacteria bacterium]